MKKSILAALAAALACVSSPAMPAATLRFGNEAADTTRINAILVDAVGRDIASPQERTAYVARLFEGVPYAAHTLEGSPEQLTVRLDSLDCTTFVETALALAYTAGERRSSWRDFVYNLERLRYRGGHMDGYGSRLHYNCDWAQDNMHRGLIADVTPRIPRTSYIVRSIDFMSRHADRYPALADSAALEAVKKVESGYRLHRFPYIRTADLRFRDVQDALRTGDVVALVTKLKDLDVTHLGIIVKDADGVPHVLHASLSAGRVVLSDPPLADFMKRNTGLLGIRVYRLLD